MKSVRNPWPWIFRALLFFMVLIPAGRAAALPSHTFSSWSADAESNTATADSTAANSEISIPPGTILPVRVGSLSSEKTKKGDVIKARIMQDVPLGNGSKLRAGSTVVGRVIDVSPAKFGQQASLTITFDAIMRGKESIPIAAHLRAIASALEVQSAQVPPIGPSESDVYDWLTTVQVGGEVVYGKGGEVYNGGRVVGRSVYDGVLAQVNAQPGTKCGGPVDGNDQLQAFWVFSSDACGTYGFPDLTISHAGRTDPQGEIVLVSQQGAIKIRSGSGMLLRVQSSEQRSALKRESNQTKSAPAFPSPQ
jgi:hypothetical protein